MSSQLRLEETDVDGAVRETAHEATEALAQEGDTRLDFLKKAGMTGGAVLGGGALLGALVPGTALAGTDPRDGFRSGKVPKQFGKGDIGILNYALTLEYLEAEFYKEANRNQKRTGFIEDGATKDFLEAVVKDEKAHVKILKDILGRKAVKKPKFDFRDTTSEEKLFVKTSFTLENTGTAAYSGQAFNIKNPKVLAGALSIVTIEARHSGLIGQILRGASGIAPQGPTETPQNAHQVLDTVKDTGFIVG